MNNSGKSIFNYIPRFKKYIMKKLLINDYKYIIKTIFIIYIC